MFATESSNMDFALLELRISRTIVIGTQGREKIIWMFCSVDAGHEVCHPPSLLSDTGLRDTLLYNTSMNNLNASHS